MHFCTLICKKGSAFTSIICSLEACLAEQALANVRSVEHAFGNASFLSVSTVLLHVTELAHLFIFCDVFIFRVNVKLLIENIKKSFAHTNPVS